LVIPQREEMKEKDESGHIDHQKFQSHARRGAADNKGQHFIGSGINFNFAQDFWKSNSLWLTKS